MNQALQTLEPAVVGVGLGKARARSLGDVAQGRGPEMPCADVRDVGGQTRFLPFCNRGDLTIKRRADIVIVVVGVELLLLSAGGSRTKVVVTQSAVGLFPSGIQV